MALTELILLFGNTISTWSSEPSGTWMMVTMPRPELIGLNESLIKGTIGLSLDFLFNLKDDLDESLYSSAERCHRM